MGVAIDTLEYARRLREAGFSEEQAEGQARALAAAMTDSLATKQDLHELRLWTESRFAQVDLRFGHLERHLDTRLEEMERRTELRFQEMSGNIAAVEQRMEMRLRTEIADLERRMTLRLGSITVAGIGIVSVLVKIL